MADITYWGLTSTKGTVAIADTSTASIDDLIAAVAADEGLPTDYYQLSKSTDPSNTLSSIVGDSTAQPTLDDLGIGDVDTVFCTTNQVGSKEERQLQKLEIAAAKRQAGGDTDKPYYRSLNTYNKNLLPNPYNGNVPEPDDGDSGPLNNGRPWTPNLEETIQTFTAVGATFNTTWTAPAYVSSVEYLVVGGGGGGGNGFDRSGGGGGAAGMVLTGTFEVDPGVTYNITVGVGGAGGADARANNQGTAGEDSVFATVTALGGVGGQGSRTYTPTARYTGGAAQIGSATSAQPGGGGGGGGSGGGGGGATGAGGNGAGTTGGAGGTGLASSITGSSITYGVGGAGGGYDTDINGANGTANRGNGGGAGGSTSASSASGGNGSSGIVILKYSEPA